MSLDTDDDDKGEEEVRGVLVRLRVGSVREDTNNDDRGEEGVRGIVVKRLNESGDVIGTTSTRGNGSNKFCNLPLGQ